MSPNVVVNSLTKTYRLHHKSPGLKGSLANLFHRKYENKRAVRNISFTIDENELVGFIGPNGAGKTTTLKMLSGLLYPTSGQVRVLGFNPWERQATFLKQISLVMGQKNQLWWDLPALESFRLAKDIYELSDQQYRHTLHTLVAMLGIEDKLNVQVRKLSLGERMKAELIVALLHRPRVLFLDEPTIGLDVVVQQTLRAFIKDYNHEFKGSILLTSHYMADVKELCQRVIIIDHGQILFDGLLADVIKKFGHGKQIELVLDKNIPTPKLKKIPGFLSHRGARATFQVKNGQVAIIASRLLSTLPVQDINIKDPDIEDVIREVFTHPHQA